MDISHLKLDGGNILKPFGVFGLRKSGSKARKGRVWQQRPLLGIECITGQSSNGVIMFAHFSRGSEVHASDGNLEFLRELNPYRSSIKIGIRVICNRV